MHSPIYLVSTCEETGKSWLEAKSLDDVALPGVEELLESFRNTESGMDWVDNTPGARGWGAPQLFGYGTGEVTKSTALAQEITLTPEQCKEYAQKYFQALDAQNEARQALAKAGRYLTNLYEYMVTEDDSFTMEQKDRWCEAICFLHRSAPFLGGERILEVQDFDEFWGVRTWWEWFNEFIQKAGGPLPEKPVKVWILTGAVMDYHY